MSWKCQLTMLNGMAGGDWEAALDRHVAWGIRILDLKDQVLGKGILDLTDAEATRAAESIQRRGLSVYCFSTVLFHGAAEAGPAACARELAQIPRAIALARILKPQVIRLLAAQTERRAEVANAIDYLRREQPQLLAAYREAIDRLHEAGLKVAIENETGRCILATPAEVRSFFAALERPQVRFIYDVQNLWECGTFPSLGVYEQLKDLIGHLHLKGGQHDSISTKLRWASALEDASWPVLEITRRAIADRVAPVICLNPSHGQRQEGYDYSDVTRRDLEFMRRNLTEVE